MRWPKYAAYIFMKYYVSKTDPKEAYVSVNYAGEVSRTNPHLKFITFLFSHKYCPIVIVIIVPIQHL
jgi:hypothetical protein